MLGEEVQLNLIRLDDANDIVLLHFIFRKLTDQVLLYKAVEQSEQQTENLNTQGFIERDGAIPSPYPGGDFVMSETQIHFMYVDNFLSKFLRENPYREHLDLNFDDKIFFHEPVNKFFDLPLLRVLAWEQLMCVRHLQNPHARSAKKQVEFENQVMGELVRCYSTQNELRRTSTEFEALMGKVIECVSGQHCTQPFKEFVQNNQNIEHVIKYLCSH